MSDGLTLAAPVAAAVVAHARAELPNEACGLLSGEPGGGAAATRFHAARNALASPTAFDVHPADLVRILFEIEGRGEELVAIFHSHPRTAAVSSATDVRNATYPAVLLVASLAGRGPGDAPTLRAWRIVGRTHAVEVPLIVGIDDQQPDRVSSTIASPESTTSTEQLSSSSPPR